MRSGWPLALEIWTQVRAEFAHSLAARQVPGNVRRYATDKSWPWESKPHNKKRYWDRRETVVERNRGIQEARTTRRDGRGHAMAQEEAASSPAMSSSNGNASATETKQPEFRQVPSRKPRAKVPEPSASVVLISPQNEVLLVHRVQSASTFPSAHVFPGGKHDESQDGRFIGGSAKLHRDASEHRRTAIRELFEETGILLARNKQTDELITSHTEERELGRRKMRLNEMRFQAWVHSISSKAELDSKNLHPFSRWITPLDMPRRFSTQMYLYFLPFSDSEPGQSPGNLSALELEQSYRLAVYDKHGSPKPDNEEVITAEFSSASTWLDKAARDEIILFPPQFMLLNIVQRFLDRPSEHIDESSLSPSQIMQRRRTNLLRYIQGQADFWPPKQNLSDPQNRYPIFPPLEMEAPLPWCKKTISPRRLPAIEKASTYPTGLSKPESHKSKSILALDSPGPELESLDGRYGDTENVVIVKFTRAGPRGLELMPRSHILTPAVEKQLVMQHSQPPDSSSSSSSNRNKGKGGNHRAKRLRNEILSNVNKRSSEVQKLRKMTRDFPSSPSESQIEMIRKSTRLQEEVLREKKDCGPDVFDQGVISQDERALKGDREKWGGVLGKEEESDIKAKL